MTTWDRYKQSTTGLEVKSYLGDIFTIRSYCDDPTGGVFVSKEPACIFSATPTVVFEGQTVNWDISPSSSSTGTIDTFDIDWGGTTSTGDLTAQDWSSDPKSGTTTYTAKGRYTIIAYVTDTLGNRSKEVKIPVTVQDTGMDEDDGSGYNSLQKVYVGTTDTGCVILSPTSAAAASNSGLSGDDLKFREMRVHPSTFDDPNGNHHLWAATAAGVAYSFDGAATWAAIDKDALGDPVNTAADGTPPVTADLDQVGIFFDPRNSQRVWVVRTSATRAWLYWTSDYGASWANVQIGTGVGTPSYSFAADAEGWAAPVAHSGHDPGTGSLAWIAGDGNDAAGCIEITTALISGSLYHGDAGVTFSQTFVGTPVLRVALKSASALVGVYPMWTRLGGGEVNSSPSSTLVTSSWVEYTFTATGPGEYIGMKITCVDPSTGAPVAVRVDDIEIVASWNYTHSAGGIPGSILVA